MSSIPSRELRKVRSVGQLHQQQERGASPYHPGKQNLDIQFQEEPYITTNNFAVFTPTVESIDKMYKSNSFQPQRFIKTPNRVENPELEQELRSQKHFTPKGGSRSSQRSSSKIFNHNKAIDDLANQIQQQRGQQQVTEQNLNKLQESRNQATPQLLHRLKSYKTNSTVEILQGLPIKKVEAQSHQFNTIQNNQDTNELTSSMKKTVSYPGLPWVQLDVTKAYQDPFSQRNLIRTQGAFRATGKETVLDMISMSKSISTNLATMLKLQKDRRFLTSNRLIPVPRIVSGPVVQHHSTGKKLLIAENDAHQRETNVGYSRKANGTFYNH